MTHTLVGATLARTRLARAGRGTTASLLIASNAPDVDIVAIAGGPLKYLEWHRGPTHGPLGVVVLGFVAAVFVWIGLNVADRRRSAAAERPRASFTMLAAVAMVGVFVHILMDLPTSYGTRAFSPFTWRWFAVDWMPIVDVYLLMILVVSLIGRATEAQRQRKAAIVLALMAANYGLRAAAHHQVLTVAPRVFGPTLPPPCDAPVESPAIVDSWPRPSVPTPPERGRRCLVEMAAMPSFMSPFRWRIVAQMSNAYELHDVDLLDRAFSDRDTASDAPWRLTLRYPNNWTPAVLTAARTRVGEKFLGFSRFPAARSAADARGVTTVRWTDVRFAGGLTTLAQPAPRTGLFTATVRLAPDGRVLEEWLGAR